MKQNLNSLRDMMREARRKKGYTQKEVARRIGCTQSAISMFESGQPDALAQEKVLELASLLGLSSDAVLSDLAAAKSTYKVYRYCNNPRCHSAIPFRAGERVRFRPRMILSDSKALSFCPWCGESMSSACGSCNAPAAPGAFCTTCGEAYVASLDDEDVNVAEIDDWAALRRAELMEILELSEPSE